jgi:type VI secretion system secreted protein Hcp
MFPTARARPPKHPRLGVERLEARDVPAWAVSPLASFAGEVTAPHEPDWVQFQVETSSPRVLLTFESAPADGSAFEPGRLQVLPGDGAHAGSPGSVSGPGHALRAVGSGLVFARAAAAAGTTGAFHVSVGLAGDVTGDHRVDAADLDRIRTLRGTRIGADGFVPAADVNHNGRIGAADLRLAGHNLGASATVGPLTIDQFLAIGGDAPGLTRGGQPGATADGPRLGLTIPGLQSEEMEVESFSWGGQNVGDAAGRPVAQEIFFTKRLDAASAKLFLALARGDHFPEATFRVRRAGPRGDVYVQYVLKDLYVSSYQFGGADGGAELPLDTFSLAYSRMTVTATPVRPDGRPGDPVVGEFDFTLLQ